MDTTIRIFRNRFIQEPQLRAQFETWLRRRDEGYLIDFSVFIDEVFPDNPENIRVLIQNFNFMLQEQGKPAQIISLPPVPGSLSIMGRPVHPRIAAQIEKEWPAARARLFLRSTIIGDENLSAEEKLILRFLLDKSAPLSIVENWYQSINTAKENPTASPSLAVLIESYKAVLHLLINLDLEDWDEEKQAELIATFTSMDVRIETISAKLRAITEKQ